jgi:iron complex transport system ATP-binding protein
MIRVDALSASHRGHAVLHDINLGILPGQLTVLIGPNASGKSTLLRSLAGIHRPDKGRILFDGEDISRLTAKKLSEILAYAPQDNPQVFAYTVRELVGIGIAGNDDIRSAMRMMDLLPLEQRSLLTLSGGERQRTAIARVLAQTTRYCLLDEPTAHLDPYHQKSLFESLREIVKGSQKGILVALHDLPLAAAYADIVILLHQGKIIAQGPPFEAMTLENLRVVYQIDAEVHKGGDGKSKLSIF